MNVPQPTAKMGMIGAQLPTVNLGPNPQLSATMPAQVGELAGLNAGAIKPEGMSQEIEAIEMRNQGAPSAQPAPMPKTKVKRKKSTVPSEPMSSQTWANIGNNPSDYPDYLAAFKKQSGKK